jgi:hypothetical protein
VPMSEPKLVRQIGLFDATMIGFGIVIGSGIYVSTGIIAASIPSAGLILLAWYRVTTSAQTATWCSALGYRRITSERVATVYPI